MIRHLLATTAAATVLTLAGGAAAEPFDFASAVIFGDSLSDTNNFARILGQPAPTGANVTNGRFSNGQVWAEYLASLRGLSVDSQAFGGATAVTRATPVGALTDLTPQVDRYLAANPTLPSNRLVGLWIGGNDYLALLGGATAPSTTQVQTTIGAVATSVGTQAGRLYTAGARDFLLVNLPPLGRIPATSAQTEATKASADQLSDLHAQAIQDVAQGLRGQGATVTVVDVNRLFRDMAANTSLYGLTNTTVPCTAPLGAGGAYVPTGACATAAGAATTVFNDAVHPTTAAHQVIAQLADASLSATYEAPAAITTATQLGLRLFDLGSQAVAGRMAAARLGGGSVTAMQPSAQAGRDGRYGLFTFGSYVDGDQDEIEGQFGFDYDGYSLGAGVDYQVDQHLLVGLAFSYANADLKTDAHYGKVDADSYGILAYGTAAVDALWFDGWLGYSYGSYDIGRATRFPYYAAAEGSTFANTYGAGATVGWTPSVGTLSIGPVAGLRYANITIDGYTEDGANFLNLQVKKFDAESLVGSLGVSAAGRFGDAGMAILPAIKIAYEYEFLNDNRRIFSNLPGSGRNVMESGSGDEGRLVGGLGLTLESGSIAATLGWEGQFTGDRDDNAFVGRVKLQF